MKLTIIGTGLIGGSIALKLREKHFVDFVYGVDQNEQHLVEAKELGIIDEGSSLENAIQNSELIILAIPVDSARKLLPSVLNLVTEKQTVMDVGSTKGGIVKAVESHHNRNRFVAFHPMWGTENSGPKSAISDSFAGKAGVICNQEESAADALKIVEQVAENLEMNLLYMDAESHDIHTAYISHISHITSYALANTVLEKEKEEETSKP